MSTGSPDACSTPTWHANSHEPTATSARSWLRSSSVSSPATRSSVSDGLSNVSLSSLTVLIDVLPIRD